MMGVPEHFNYPFIQLVKEQPLISQEIQLEWENEPRGSGAMNVAIRENNVDLAVILTESFIKDKIDGNSGSIIGFHVRSPLRWGIHVPSSSRLQELNDVKNVPFLVSRMGSGSHLMAYLLAKKAGWSTEGLEFEIVGNLDGARKAFKKITPKVFLWEKFTTQPLVSSGEFRRIGEIPTPWPCFVLVASERMLSEFPNVLKQVQDLVYAKNKSLKSDSQKTIEEVATYYKLEKPDIVEWFDQTDWATNAKVSSQTLEHAMLVLKDLKLISQTVTAKQLLAKEFVELV